MNKVSYLKGLLDGLDVNPESREGKIFYAVCEALEESAKYTEELENRVAELEELCDILDEDLGLVEEMLEDDNFSCTNCSGLTVAEENFVAEPEAVSLGDKDKSESEEIKETEEQEKSVEETEKIDDILTENITKTEEDFLGDGKKDFLGDGEEEYETVCPTCGHCILLDERMLEEGETVCPNCGEELEFDFDAEEIEKLAPADEE
ncbi:MAG: hypothetical protein K2O52_08020 [Oscillospiraceae bacterium]|nr:hypothetical protein [Oscillospiraceae bacterium]